MCIVFLFPGTVTAGLDSLISEQTDGLNRSGVLPGIIYTANETAPDPVLPRLREKARRSPAGKLYKAGPTLYYPSDGSNDLSFPIEFAWGPVYDASFYYLQISTSESMGGRIYEKQLDQNHHEIGTNTNLDYGETYYWRVAAVVNGSYERSEVWSFTTAPVPPTRPA